MSNLFLAPAPFDFTAIFGNFAKRWYYYVVLIVAITLLVLYTVRKKKKRNELSNTQKLVYTAIMSALAFVANYFTIKMSESLQISLVAFVGFFAGYMLGSGLGFASAFIGDFICGIVAPFGAYNPIIGVGTGLWGFIPGFIFETFEGNDYIKSIISFALCFILNSFAINTFGLSVMYSSTFESLLILLPTKLLTVTINAIICVCLLPIMPRILPKDKFPFVNGKERIEE